MCIDRLEGFLSRASLLGINGVNANEDVSFIQATSVKLRFVFGDPVADQRPRYPASSSTNSRTTQSG